MCEVKTCEPVKKSKKLLQFTIFDGVKDRTVVSGIANYYKPEELIGKKIILVQNLKPAKLCGVESCGMILSAVHGDDLKVVFVDNKLLPDLQLKAFFETGNLQLNNHIAMTIYRYSEDQGYLKTLTKKYERSNIHILTDRELEIIRLCYKGLSSKMIAEKLNLSIHTVKNHKRNSMEKTMTHNIVELLRICLKNKWL